MPKSVCIISLILLLILIPESLQNAFPDETWQSGYISLTRETDKLFYLLFRSRHPSDKIPLVIWLSGGPGCASTLGMLEENGPYRINRKTFRFERNPYSWNELADVLYVDQPLGTGYSITPDDTTMCRDEKCVANNFAIFLSKFYQTYPEYSAKPLFITGESYAGRYIPAIVAGLYRNRGAYTGLESLVIRGISIGNPYIEPITQSSTYPLYLYQNGLVGLLNYTLLSAATLVCQVGITIGLPQSNQLCDMYTLNLVDLVNPSDIKDNSTYYPMHGAVRRKLSEPAFQRELGVNKTTFSLCSQKVSGLMEGEHLRSQREDLEFVLNQGVSTFLYFGADDSVCDWMGGNLLILGLDWAGTSDFSKQPLKDWTVAGRKAGEIREFGALRFVKVLDSGHMVPLNQPLAALQMLRELLDKKTNVA